MKITTRLIASFSTVIVLSGVMGLIGYRGLTSVSADLEDVGTNRGPSVQALLTIQEACSTLRGANSTLMIESLPPERRAMQKTFREESYAGIKRGWDIYAPLPQTDEEARVWSTFETKFTTWSQAAKEIASLIESWEQAKDEAKPAEAIAGAYSAAMAKFLEGAGLFAALKPDLDKLVALNVDLATQETNRGLENSKSALTTMTAAIGILVLVGAVLAALSCITISRSLKVLIVRLKDIAEGDGDLTKRVEIKSKDEIGAAAQMLNKFLESIHSVISQVSGATTQVAAAATEIAASAEEMAAAVGEVARQSTSAAQRSQASGDLASEGGEIVAATIAGMKEIETAVSQSATSVTALGKRGEEIGHVITMINDIADQTNLLALNAAIEAARAGEHGRGFAVVADEVRKLADRTTKATEEIGGSIRAIQGETTTAATRMNRGSEQVKTGVTNAERAGVSLEQIVGGTRDLASMITSISAAAEEAGAGASQSASAATELSSKAELLRTLVERFKV